MSGAWAQTPCTDMARQSRRSLAIDAMQWRLKAAFHLDSCRLLADMQNPADGRRYLVIMDTDFKLQDTLGLGRDSSKPLYALAESGWLYRLPAHIEFATVPITHYQVSEEGLQPGIKIEGILPKGLLGLPTPPLPGASLKNSALLSNRVWDIKGCAVADRVLYILLKAGRAARTGKVKEMPIPEEFRGLFLLSIPIEPLTGELLFSSSQANRLPAFPPPDNPCTGYFTKKPLPKEFALPLAESQPLGKYQAGLLLPDSAGVVEWLPKIQKTHRSSAPPGYCPRYAWCDAWAGQCLALKTGHLGMKGLESNYGDKNRIATLGAVSYSLPAGNSPLEPILNDVLLTHRPIIYFNESWLMADPAGDWVILEPETQNRAR